MPHFAAASAYDHQSQPYETPRQKYDGTTKSRKPCCSTCMLIKLGFLLIVLLGVAIALVIVLAPPGGPKEWFLHTPPAGLTAAIRWQNGGYGGLKLTVLNAVDGSYQTLFSEWIEKWENSTPAVLNLTTERVSYDSDCAPIDGVLKVCNGNYGNTGWRGIDMSTLYNGYVINSAAKLNDYYLNSGKQEWKEYTMCHELGHGWGLPHTDQDYYNSPSGNCMDLTLKVGDDLQPGQIDFNLLVQMYGTLDGKINATKIGNSTLPNSNSSTYGGSARRSLKQPTPGFLRRLQLSEHRSLVEARYLSAAKAFEKGNLCDKLAGTKTGCALDLGHGYTLHTHLLPVAM